jgi:hypothetical protein
MAVGLSACVPEFGTPPRMRSWGPDFRSYRVIGNIHYVGSTDLAQFLMTTS